jgi:hypothetical protein
MFPSSGEGGDTILLGPVGRANLNHNPVTEVSSLTQSPSNWLVACEGLTWRHCRWMSDHLHTLSLHTPGEEPLYLLDGRLDGHHSLPGHGGKQTKTLSLHRI